MIKPILACDNPYIVSEVFKGVGWNIDFSQPIESGDPLVGVSLCGNEVLLGITEGYVNEADKCHIGCGVELYLTVPAECIEDIYDKHRDLCPSKLETQLWGALAFEVCICGFKFMIATT